MSRWANKKSMDNKYHSARTLDVRSVGVVVALVVAITGYTTAPVATQEAPRIDRSKPPTLADSAEAFTVRRLSSPLSIDGRSWIAIQNVSVPGTLRAPNGQFTLTLEESSSVEIVHYRISLTEVGGAPVELDPGAAVYAFITPDSRWIITGTLEMIDMRDWRKYSLSRAFNIEPYVILRAISADGGRLVISRQDCPFDCRDLPAQYYEIGFPAG